MHFLDKIPAAESGTIKSKIISLGPELAAEFLKRNTNNRKIKEPTVYAYTNDMRNGQWLLTHQAIAFDEAGNLIDGQHRLHAIVRSRATVLMFVTAGWSAGKGKKKTMDGVDRGTNRSIQDQLRLQHGIDNAGPVVQVANAIASACQKANRVRKGSTASVLYVVSLFPDEIRFVLDNIPRSAGLKKAAVLGCIALGRAIWPDKTSDFWTRLTTGENLTRDNPALHLRNWLMGDGIKAENNEIRNGVLHCLKAFVDGRAIQNFSGKMLVGGEAVAHVLQALGERPKKIAEFYGVEAPPSPTGVAKANGNGHIAPPMAKADTSPFGAEAIRIGGTLQGTFTTTDLRARQDNDSVCGVWLVHWRNRGWIEAVGVNQFRKTEKFPVG